jgi:hypothetical protein
MIDVKENMNDFSCGFILQNKCVIGSILDTNEKWFLYLGA